MENDFFKSIESNDTSLINQLNIKCYDELNDIIINGKRCWDLNIEELTYKQEKYLNEIIKDLEKIADILEKYRK